MDIDPSSIPSSDNGIVMPGNAKSLRFLKSNDIPNRSTAVISQMLQDVKIEDLIKSNTQGKDFSMHIEPDWNNDSQTCLVVYRHKGRVVARMNPRQIDLALARHMPGKQANKVVSDCDTDNSPPYKNLTECEIIRLSVLQGGRPVEPEEQLIEIAEQVPGYMFKPVVLQTAGMINAFLCISCLYEGWEAEKRLVIVSTQEEFEAAMSRFAKVVDVAYDCRSCQWTFAPTISSR
jgi:hypothetical protein